MPDLELFKFLSDILGLDLATVHQVAIVIIALAIYSLGNKLVSGWIDNRKAKREHRFSTEEQWREYAERLSVEIGELRDKQVFILVNQIEELEGKVAQLERRSEADALKCEQKIAEVEERAAAEVAKWQVKSDLAEAVAEDQKVTIVELEGRIAALEGGRKDDNAY